MSQQKMLLLPGGQVQVNGITSDLAGALNRLGPPDTTQVNITGCSNLPFSTIQKAKEAVESAGYSRIGFAVAEGPDLALCQAGR
jgi:biopolymer transport protein ExbD